MLVAHNESIPSAEEHFGSQVRQARELRGWSQEALARHLRETAGLDLHQTAVARLEQGNRAIRLNEASALAKLLGLDLQAFSGTLPRLTKEEYEQAKKSLAEVIEQQERATHQSDQARRQLEDELEQIERDRRYLTERRWRYEAMIGEYEGRQDG